MVKMGYVYKIVCSDVSITECYVGSTTNLRIRKNQHKNTCNNVDDKSYNLPVYQFIRENGGFQNWIMVAVVEIEFENRMVLNACEREWIENLHATLNRVVPTRTQKKYREGSRKNDEEEIKHGCCCGGIYTQSHLSQHVKSKQHQEFEQFMNLQESM